MGKRLQCVIGKVSIRIILHIENTSALTNASSRQEKEAVLLATISRRFVLLTVVNYSYKTISPSVSLLILQ